MKTYCKAYALAELRQFPGWSTGSQPTEQELTDEEFVYLCDDFTVLTNPIKEEGVLFTQVTPEWREFCATTLDFHVPGDLASPTPNRKGPETVG
jgi:hypothetical protein